MLKLKSRLFFLNSKFSPLSKKCLVLFTECAKPSTRKKEVNLNIPEEHISAIKALQQCFSHTNTYLHPVQQWEYTFSLLPNRDYVDYLPANNLSCYMNEGHSKISLYSTQGWRGLVYCAAFVENGCAILFRGMGVLGEVHSRVVAKAVECLGITEIAIQG
jgi:hypothetical protein